MHDEEQSVEKPAALDCDAEKARVDVQSIHPHLVSDGIENTSRPGSDTDGSSNTINEKQLLRRIDFTLIPWLVILYMLCFLDRSNIGNARLYNLEADLHLSDAEYLMSLTLFYIPYVLCEVPANTCLKRIRPSIWLPVIMLLWGITTQGLVHDFGGILALRIFLGIFEAGFYPGVLFYMSCWYRRNEFGFRFAMFFAGGSLAGAFGGFLAAAISNMDGVGGKPVWAWIFILEGLFTIIVASASFFIIQDYPPRARFLSEQERVYVVRRLGTDDKVSVSNEQQRWRDVRSAFTDWKTSLAIGGWLIFPVGAAAAHYSISFFLPTIISHLGETHRFRTSAGGFSANKANLLTVPVHLVAALVSCLVNSSVDRLRMLQDLESYAIPTAFIGCLIQMLSRNAALSYFATYMIALYEYLLPSYFHSWASNNAENSYKRSIVIAIVTSVANIVGAISMSLFREQDAPRYIIGNSFSVAATVVGFISSIVLHMLLRRENECRDRGERDEVIGDSESCYGDIRNGRYESVEAAKRDKGDEWSGFRYIT
ncbi:MFS general substrate transporter [Fomitiporia mediterranea MF3/22]|uniref:MFS general substrate transporter n=1 Tax=Fomitiporia mediterranea (strain MF3/22) TaxID=694068 RepID=UPI00044089A4|nr:MFS general substrate transporter [Fomitiporia mediterranea MF3/22]EJC99323.1 MFS general substrate transporter [Fomitiporia mediterranea MF3/22]